jgi:predicted membrane channel-forming protein YqfA (hemolysin III family)
MPLATSIATHVLGAIASVLLAIVSVLQKVLEQPQDATADGGWLLLLQT